MTSLIASAELLQPARRLARKADGAVFLFVQGDRARTDRASGDDDRLPCRFHARHSQFNARYAARSLRHQNAALCRAPERRAANHSGFLQKPIPERRPTCPANQEPDCQSALFAVSQSDVHFDVQCPGQQVRRLSRHAGQKRSSSSTPIATRSAITARRCLAASSSPNVSLRRSNGRKPNGIWR